MIDQRSVERAAEQFRLPEGSFERLVRRRDRKRRNQRIAAGVVGIILALVSFVTLTRAFRSAERPADEPTPRPKGIFSEIGGWIAYGNKEGWTTYGNKEGIWAVNPTRPGDPDEQIQLSERDGEPLAWSSDGSNLLIRRHMDGHRFDLFVLRSDGSETRLTRTRVFTDTFSVSGGSFTPDGSQVIYAARGNIYTIDSVGGTRQLLDSRGGPDAPLFDPVLSPDGSRIAYFDGAEGLDLRVMNLDGSGDRKLVDDVDLADENPVWSPDGSRLAYCCHEGGIWIIRADGTDLTKVIPSGVLAHWSPDGSRISYQREILPSMGQLGTLEIATVDGTHVQEFGYAGSGPWNPLPLSASGEQQSTATVGRSGAAPLVYAIAVLGAVGVLVIAWRARRRTAAR